MSSADNPMKSELNPMIPAWFNVCLMGASVRRVPGGILMIWRMTQSSQLASLVAMVIDIGIVRDA